MHVDACDGKKRPILEAFKAKTAGFMKPKYDNGTDGVQEMRQKKRDLRKLWV